MTGGKATVESIEVGGAFTAWDGYIDGVHVALESGRRIVQTWRSDDFPADATESYLEVRLEPAPGGTLLTIRHTEIPEGQGPAYLAGWDEHYLAPMARFFAAEARRRGRKAAPARRAARAGASRRSRPAAKATGRQASGRSGRKPVRKPVRKPRRQATRTPRR
jgi:hypothetical protein